jgi:ribose transport system permease protein
MGSKKLSARRSQMATSATNAKSVNRGAADLSSNVVLGFIKRNVEILSLAASILVLALIFSSLNPRFATVENLQNLLNQAGLPLIIAVGATFVILIGSIDLSVEGVMSACGMAFVLLSANSRGGTDFGFWAYVVAIGLGATLGFFSGVLFTKVKVPSFIVTLGMWYVGLGIATVMFGTDTMPFLTNDNLSTWASQQNLGMPNNFLLGLLVAILGALLLRFTSFGRVTLAVGNNEEIARGNGLKVTRNKVTIFILAGAISGIAGIVATIQLGAVNPTIAAGNLFIALPAVVIGGTSLAGGKGSMLGTVLGVILLTTLTNGLTLADVSPNFKTAVSGAILVLAIVITAWSQRDRLRISK